MRASIFGLTDGLHRCVYDVSLWQSILDAVFIVAPERPQWKTSNRASSPVVTMAYAGLDEPSDVSSRIRGPHATVTFYQINYPSSFVLDAAVCIAVPAVSRVVLHHISISIQTPPDHTCSRPCGKSSRSLIVQKMRKNLILNNPFGDDHTYPSWMVAER